MGAVGIIGLLLCIPALLWVTVRHGAVTKAIALSMLIIHVAFAVVYMQYTLSSGGDSLAYYHDPLGWSEFGFKAGTIFTASLTQLLKQGLSASYLDCFVFFQAFGFCGLMLVLRIFQEVSDEYDVIAPNPLYLLLFLPGLHFWTVAVGKDAPLFMGAATAVWACLNINRRFVFLGLAIVLMYAFRPHVALLAFLAVAATLAIDSRTKKSLKALLVVAGIVALPAMFSFVQAYVRIDSFSVEGVSSFLERQDRIAGYFDGGAAIIQASYPQKLFTLLFRPFFFDANGLMGLVASFENTIWLAVFVYLGFQWRSLAILFWTDTGARFSLLFATGLILMLAAINYNVGLGLRQKMMVMPAILYVLYHVMALNARQPAGAGRVNTPA